MRLSTAGTSWRSSAWVPKQTDMFTDVKMVEATAAGHSCAPARKVHDAPPATRSMAAKRAAAYSGAAESVLREGSLVRPAK